MPADDSEAVAVLTVNQDVAERIRKTRARTSAVICWKLVQALNALEAEESPNEFIKGMLASAVDDLAARGAKEIKLAAG